MRNFFTIFHETTDMSKQLKDFGTASVALPMAVGEYLYVGYDKPFKQFYVEMDVASTSGNISAEYFDGSSWQALTILDETNHLANSGFIFFDKPDNWTDTTINDKELFYIRLSSSVDLDVTTKVKGLAILLANDLDLEGIRSNIVSKFNSGSSWVLKHEQARKDIVQLLRNAGNRKVKNADKNNPLVTESVKFSDVNEFDILEPEQLRQAATYKVMSMIYLDELSDSVDDKWYIQGKRYEATFSEMFNLFYLQIDVDDDGEADDGETLVSTSTGLSWK